MRQSFLGKTACSFGDYNSCCDALQQQSVAENATINILTALLFAQQCCTINNMTLTPAKTVISAFGGVRATARAAGISPSSVSRWQVSKDVNGTGGLIPTAVQRKLLEEAKKKQIILTADDLIFGRVISDE